MGKLATAGAIAGLGEGIAKRGEEKAQTAREIRLQELRNSGQLEAQKQAGTDALARQDDTQAEARSKADTEYFQKWGKLPPRPGVEGGPQPEEGGTAALEHKRRLEELSEQEKIYRARLPRNLGEDDTGVLTVPGYIDQENNRLVPEQRIPFFTKKDKDGNVMGQYATDPSNGKDVPVQFLINKDKMPPNESRLYQNPGEIGQFLEYFPMPWWFEQIYPEHTPDLGPNPQSSVDTTGQNEGGEGAGGMLSQAATAASA